jgi:hypothetical protein
MSGSSIEKFFHPKMLSSTVPLLQVFAVNNVLRYFKTSVPLYCTASSHVSYTRGASSVRFALTHRELMVMLGTEATTA